ncbi:hypothetical protein [Crocosphaera sp.]
MNNQKSFDNYQLYPKVLVNIIQINLSTKLLGQTLCIAIRIK